MSRHRNIRNLDYDEEYDEAYDDSVYGRSVDDHEFALSPSQAQYVYNFSKSNFNNFLMQTHGSVAQNSVEFKEEQEECQSQAADEEALMLSVVDQLKEMLGDSASEQEMRDAALKFNFSVEDALNSLLTKPVLPQAASGRGKKNKKEMNAAKSSIASSAAKQANNRPSNRAEAEAVCGQAVVVTASPDNVLRGFAVEQPAGEYPLSGSCSLLPVTPSSSNNSASTAASTTASCATPIKPFKIPTKQREASVDVAALYDAACSDLGSKQLLNLVVVGHVDAGKSTLTGHLLYKQGTVSKRQMHKYEQESRKAGKQSMYAWVMDNTEEERTRGVTVDVAERSFETANRVINILDAPGHRDFIPNMISGAARADVALLVVDASSGEFEAGFESNGQTREHAMLIKSLGVSQIAVAVNKLDTVHWLESRFNDIRSSLGSFLKTVGYRSSDVVYVPCSGLTGENLVQPAQEAALVSWYSGPTVLQVIDQMKPPTREVLRPTRFSISDVFKGGSTSLCTTGKLHTGYLQAGDKLILLPHTIPLSVKDVVNGSGRLGQLFAGDSGTLTLSGVTDHDMVQVGCFLSDPGNVMPQTSRLRARIVVFAVTVPIIKGAQMEFHLQTLCEPAIVKRLVALINKSTGEVIRNDPRVLPKQSAGIVDIEFSHSICVETYKDNKELGRFMLRQQGVTVAAGLVSEILDTVCSTTAINTS